MDDEFEIHFADLTKEAQGKFLEFEGIRDPSGGNYDVFPIAVIPKPDPS